VNCTRGQDPWLAVSRLKAAATRSGLHDHVNIVQDGNIVRVGGLGRTWLSLANARKLIAEADGTDLVELRSFIPSRRWACVVRGVHVVVVTRPLVPYRTIVQAPLEQRALGLTVEQL
jgi:hypothetical protein